MTAELDAYGGLTLAKGGEKATIGSARVGCAQGNPMTAGDGFMVRLLGRPAVAGLAPDVVFPAKGHELLALLALSADRRAARKEAASLLWDATSDEMALANLRQLLARLKKALPGFEAIVNSGARDLELGPSAASHVDLVRLLETLPRGGVEPLSLVAGDLLEGVTDTSDAFAHWLARERARLAEMIFEAATTLLIEMTRYGRAKPGEIARVGERMLALAPEREATYRSLIEAYGRAGLFEEAKRAEAEMRAMLAREGLGEPTAETKAVIRRVFASRIILPAPPEAPAERKERAQPRIAFLAPTWLEADATGQALLKALIEDVANELARYRSFVMLAPHSSFQIDHDSGMPADNSVLKADYTVSGFVKPGGEVLSLRMANCATGEIVWAGEFGVGADALKQSAWLLARQVAGALSSAVERDVLSALRNKGDAGSYYHYLTGREAQAGCDLISLRRARKAFTRSIDLDHSFAPAHARLAESLMMEWILMGGRDAAMLSSARDIARHAVGIDPGNAAGHWMSGAVALYQRDYDNLLRFFEEAETLNPNSADFQLDYGDALAHTGDADLGWSHFKRAIELNPLPPDRYWWFGAGIAFAREDFAEAVRMCRNIKSQDIAMGIRAASFAMAGEMDDARHWARKLVDTLPGLTVLDYSLLHPGRSESQKSRYVEGLKTAGVK